MHDSIAHLIGERQRQLRMLNLERRVVLLDVVAGLANDLKVTDHGILHQFILQKGDFIQFICIAADPLDRLQDMRKNDYQYLQKQLIPTRR